MAVSPAAKELGADGPHERLYAELNVTEVGYVYAYLSSDAPTPIEVYVACPDKVGDDFSVTHIQSPIVAGADYYPYGLVMEGREITDEAYRYGYQGQYAEKDETTGYNEFQLRFYDAKIARWLSADPYGQYYSPYVAMGNVPNSGIDPDGGFCTTCFQPLFDVLTDPVFLAKLSGDIILSGIVKTAARTWDNVANAALRTGLRIANGARNTLEGTTTIVNGINKSFFGDLVPDYGGHTEYANSLREMGQNVGYAAQA